jgi:hypothetical protein
MRSTISTWKAIVAKVFVAAMIILSVAVVPTAVKAADAPSLNKSSRNILIGSTYNLNVTSKVKGSTYEWTTSDSKIATVNQNGIVKGKKAGAAVITCTVTAPDANYSLTCNVTIIQRALVFSINNKVSALNVGQVYDLNRTIKPSTSNDKTKWTSSNTSIAAPDKNGKFTALKTGTVTITGTTLSGESDSVTIKVVDADGTVSTQAALDALLGTGVQKITLKTDAKVDITIPSGQYTGTTLVVDAPNADVHNSGVFAKIDILNIAANSWYEDAVGNFLNIIADTSRVVVGPNAKVSIEVNADGAKLVIVNGGQIEEFVIDKPAEVDISGDSEQTMPITVDIPGVTITTSLPLNLECKAKIDLVLLAGAEKTILAADTEENVPDISGNVTINVTVGTGENKEIKKIEGTPLADTKVPTPAGGAPSGGSNAGTVTKTNNSDGTVTFALSQVYTNLTAITVSYNNQTYSINGMTLSLLKDFLSDASATTSLWYHTTSYASTTSGQAFAISGDADSYTKTVTFTGGQLDGKSYVATVNYGSNSVTVSSNQSPAVFTITKVNDYTLKISASVPTLTFSPTF